MCGWVSWGRGALFSINGPLGGVAPSVGWVWCGRLVFHMPSPTHCSASTSAPDERGEMWVGRWVGGWVCWWGGGGGVVLDQGILCNTSKQWLALHMLAALDLHKLTHAQAHCTECAQCIQLCLEVYPPPPSPPPSRAKPPMSRAPPQSLAPSCLTAGLCPSHVSK
jgi:hypothetical protein